MKCAIVCGGLGTRLGTRAGAVPKVLAPFGGRPLLDHLLDTAADAGVNECVLLTGHQSAAIETHVGARPPRSPTIDVCREAQPLGTAGAIKAVAKRFDDDFLVLYGDVMLSVDLARMFAFHRSRRALATLAVHPNDHPHDSDLLALGQAGRIAAFYPNPRPAEEFYPNLVNAGVYLLSPAILDRIPAATRCDFGRDVFPQLVEPGGLFGYQTAEYIKDIGTPERYARTCRDWESGIVARLHLRYPRPAVFLDRDGVLNREIGGVRTAEDLLLLPRAAEAVRSINESGRLAVVVTNQPLVAKGQTSFDELERIHRKMQTVLGRTGAYLDALYFCPHHPEAGFDGEIPELKVPCDCRKPGIGMIQRAADDLHVDLTRSVLVGDTARDFACARAAGMQAIGVRSGLGWEPHEVQPHLAVADLYEAVGRLGPWTAERTTRLCDADDAVRTESPTSSIKEVAT